MAANKTTLILCRFCIGQTTIFGNFSKIIGGKDI